MRASPKASGKLVVKEVTVDESASVDEVVIRVLNSEQLKTLIATVAAEHSTEGQFTTESVSSLIK